MDPTRLRRRHLVLASTLALGLTGTASASGPDAPLWLEQAKDPRALAWVAQQNEHTLQAMRRQGDLAASEQRILDVLNSNQRIPYVSHIGHYYYNFWRDKDHPHGLYRRTTLQAYRQARPQWETVLDLDALNRREGKSWVWKGAQCLRPDYQRCLISLSPDGGDAVEVREYDLASHRFVKDGFHLPVAKSTVDWIDRDHLFVATTLGKDAETRSSYPRVVSIWQRGTPLASRVPVYQGKASDMAVSGSHDGTPGFERNLISVSHDFYHSQQYLLKADHSLQAIDVPEDASASPYREWLLIQTRSPWTVGGHSWPAGTLLVSRFDDYLAGKRELTPLFLPDAHRALAGAVWTRHHLIVTVLHDVKSELLVLTPQADGHWSSEPLAGAPQNSSVEVVDTDPDHDDEYWMTVTGFLTPPSLARGVIGEIRPEVIKQSPAFFATEGLAVHQYFATSRDGTKVPYYLVGPKDLKLDGRNPTLEYGYGGFEVSLTPGYNPVMGREWLARGGVYVLANIRGGGEYGPTWHSAALRENRPKAYQDFAAVAEDLVARKITSAPYLAAMGGSNGGLLAGNMLVSYPQLYGAIVSQVPLLDMKRFVKLQAGTSWIAEYGNPDKPSDWAFMKTFSPFQLARAGQPYPATLFITTSSDDRVGPGQARAMKARLDDLGYKNMYFFESAGGGHGSGADNTETARFWALNYQFLWQHLKQAPPADRAD